MDSGSLAGAPRLVADGGMRIGDAHDPDAGFTVVRGAAVDRDGDIIVLEESVPEFRVYDAEGTLLRRFGRRGGGEAVRGSSSVSRPSGFSEIRSGPSISG